MTKVTSDQERIADMQDQFAKDLFEHCVSSPLLLETLCDIYSGTLSEEEMIDWRRSFKEIDNG